MIRVFLVEDEYIIREGIRKKINWSANGYEFCGEAADGEMALPLIQKCKPDILITDIRMPFMDGIELSRIVKKELPDTEIIVLSGFGEFEYAKECISIGVADYLLKPISGDVLLQKVGETAQKIEEKQRERQIARKYAGEMEENQYRSRLDLFQNLVTGDVAPAQLLEMAAQQELNLAAGCYCVMLFRTWVPQHKPGEYSQRLMEADHEIEKILQKEHMILFDRNLEGKAVLFKADSETEMQELTTQFSEKMKIILDGIRDMRYFAGIGKMVSRISSIPDSFESAGHIFAHRYFVNENSIMSSLDLPADSTQSGENFDMNRVDPRQFDRTRVLEFLKQGSREEVKYFTEEFFAGIDSESANSTILKQYLCMDIYFCAVQFVEELSASREELTAPDMLFTSGNAFDEVKKYILQTIEKTLEIRDRMSVNRYDSIVTEVTRYIAEHFQDPDLSLNTLAAHVNFSPNHLSAVFSQQTGRTFIRYLTDYRLNRAKEMLRCTSYRSSEICSSVGYKDPHYFSYLFKKTFGVTPTQYRDTEGV